MEPAIAGNKMVNTRLFMPCKVELHILPFLLGSYLVARPRFYLIIIINKAANSFYLVFYCYQPCYPHFHLILVATSVTTGIKLCERYPPIRKIIYITKNSEGVCLLRIVVHSDTCTWYCRNLIYGVGIVGGCVGGCGIGDRVIRDGSKYGLVLSVVFRSIACPFLYTVKVRLLPTDLY